MSAAATMSNILGKAATEGGDGKASSELRERHIPGDPEPKRGRGRPAGSMGKPKAAPAPAAAAPAKTSEFVYTKVGKAFRSIFNIMAIKTDCTAWLLDADEEKDLGESFGDLLLDVGLADSTAVKCVFAAGSLMAVAGTKAISYQIYARQLAASRTKPGPLPAPVNAAPAPSPVDAKVADTTVIPETKPGIV